MKECIWGSVKRAGLAVGNPMETEKNSLSKLCKQSM